MFLLRRFLHRMIRTNSSILRRSSWRSPPGPANSGARLREQPTSGARLQGQGSGPKQRTQCAERLERRHLLELVVAKAQVGERGALGVQLVELVQLCASTGPADSREQQMGRSVIGSSAVRLPTAAYGCASR